MKAMNDMFMNMNFITGLKWTMTLFFSFLARKWYYQMHFLNIPVCSLLKVTGLERLR